MKTKRSTRRFWAQNYLKWILYGLITVAVMLMQSAARFFPVIANARPTPLVLLVVCVAMLEGARVGATVAVFAGLLWDLYTFRLFGLNALLMLCIAVVVGLLVELLLRTNFLSALLLCAGGVLTHAIIEWLLSYALFLHEETMQVLLKVYLPNALYTLLLAPFMYCLVLWVARFMRRRMNE